MPRINYSPYIEKMEEAVSDLVGEVTVVDVYDIASDIGKECEKIIDQYGADAVTSLMPKVINALELLENLATKNERENTQLHELQAKISQLENDKLEKAEYRQKFEKVSFCSATLEVGQDAALYLSRFVSCVVDPLPCRKYGPTFLHKWFRAHT